MTYTLFYLDTDVLKGRSNGRSVVTLGYDTKNERDLEKAFGVYDIREIDRSELTLKGFQDGIMQDQMGDYRSGDSEYLPMTRETAMELQRYLTELLETGE